MARSYGKIEAAMWQNPKVHALSDAEKLLWSYLIACPHGNAIGTFVLADGYIAADLRWPADRVAEQVGKLVSKRFIERCERTSLVRLIGWFGHNSIENRNVAKSAVRQLLALPRGVIFSNTVKAINSYGNTFLNEFMNSSAHEFRNMEREPEREPDRDPEMEFEQLPLEGNARQGQASEIPDRRETDADDGETEFESWYDRYPRKVAKGGARKAFASVRRHEKVPLAELIAATARFAESVAEKDDQFIPHPATWLNDERWLEFAPSADAADPGDRIDKLVRLKLRLYFATPTYAADGETITGWTPKPKSRWFWAFSVEKPTDPDFPIPSSVVDAVADELGVPPTDWKRSSATGAQHV